MMGLRPVGYVLGYMIVGLGLAMLAPAVVDIVAGEADWRAFVLASVLTLLVGSGLTLGCATDGAARLEIEHAFLVVVLSWVVLPIFGALPFALGEPDARAVDALFEAVSGVTTTGATIFSGLEAMPPGILLWRALLQWIGGIGIVVFAMMLLPTLQVGGMQLFRSEAFDTQGKILPRVRDLALIIGRIYIVLTLACAFAYGAFGMSSFDAICHAMTTVATGGFANYDDSFAAFTPGAQVTAVVFMILASLPFTLYVPQGIETFRSIVQDPQVRGFITVIAVAWLLLIVGLFDRYQGGFGELLLHTLFNLVSLVSGTGYANADFATWGPFAVSLLFVLMLVGGCAGSTCCSVKIFRYQVLGALMACELQRLRRPNGVFTARYNGRKISPDVVVSVLAFFFAFLVALAALTLALAATGLDHVTALSGAASALANVGPGFGDEIGPTQNFMGLSDTAKGLLIVGMLLGRLELLSVLVLLSPNFWRR